MVYLTFEEYEEIGGTLNLTAFLRQVDRACGIIDNETHNRIVNSSRKIKACCRDLVEYLNAHDTLHRENVVSKSQSVGGVSESESYGVKTADEMWGDIQNILYDYLLSEVDCNGVSLLYRGARND